MHGWPETRKWWNIVIILQNLKCVPNLLVNLFSISKALKNVFNLGNEDVVMKLMKEDITLYFHRLFLKTKSRLVSDIKLIPMLGKIVTIAFESTEVKNNIDNLYKIINSWVSVRGYNQNDWEMLWIWCCGRLYDMWCLFSWKCKKGEYQRRLEGWQCDSVTVGERLYIDISSIKGEAMEDWNCGC